MIRNAKQFLYKGYLDKFALGQVNLETTLSQIQEDAEELTLKEIKQKITEEIQRQMESEMRYSDTNTIPSMVRMYDPVSGKLIVEFPYSERNLYVANSNCVVQVDPCWSAWACRHDDDALKPACSVKELLEQTQGEKDDKMGTVF